MEMDILGSDWKAPIKAAAVQTKLELGDIDACLAGVEGLIDGITSGPEHDLLVFPEMFASGFAYDQLEEIAGRSPEVLAFMKGVARETSSHLMFTIARWDGGQIVNRAYLMSPGGDVSGHYDKSHLFSPSGEDRYFRAGSNLKIFHLGDVLIGPLICYEIRYPEMSRRYTLEGAQILVYMAQWPKKRIFQWEVLLRARAIENQCFVIGSSISGLHGNTPMGGRSMIVSPFGQVLSSLDDGPSLCSSELDPKEMYRFRKGIPALSSRRPEMY